MLRLLLLLSVCTVVACADGRPASDQPAYPTTALKVVAPDRIYFKNIRSTRYALEENYQSHQSIYTHKKLVDTPGWRWSITDDWLNDRAWLSMEAPNGGVYLRPADDEQEPQIRFDVIDLKDPRKLGVFADQLAAGYELCFRSPTVKKDACERRGSAVRQALRETISDYLRLTARD